ncbi:MAG: helix-turn-helix domain-containing protein [Bacteriovoracaceae bacterium]|nr:helix-turn-helix domain-containing protein [Bacteriovoracaceae bacterium]
MNSDHFDIDQAAKFLNVKVSRLRTAILRKEIPYFKVGRLVRFHKHDLEKWIDDLRRQTQKKF